MFNVAIVGHCGVCGTPVRCGAAGGQGIEALGSITASRSRGHTDLGSILSVEGDPLMVLGVLLDDDVDTGSSSESSGSTRSDEASACEAGGDTERHFVVFVFGCGVGLGGFVGAEEKLTK